jgi:hypothetical protein
MVMGAPKKHLRGIWHEEARRLRDEDGWTYQRIALQFDVTSAAVYFVCNPDKRAMYGMKKGARNNPRAPVSAKP